MASKGHDFIVETIKIKMREQGYEVIAMESLYRNQKNKIPPTIVSHRPDIIGYNKEIDTYCIGESKYYGDLSSKRSLNQIKDFIGLTTNNELNINVIFGIPLSEENSFFKKLKKLSIILNDKIILLKIPDRLIPQNDKA